MNNSDTPQESDRRIQAVIFQDMILSLGTVLHLKTMLNRLVDYIASALPCDRVIILIADDENVHLIFGGVSPAVEDAETQQQLESLSLTLYNAEPEFAAGTWLSGSARPLSIGDVANDVALDWLASTLPVEYRYSQPILHGHRLVGAIIVDNATQPFSDETLSNCGPLRWQEPSFLKTGACTTARFFKPKPTCAN